MKSISRAARKQQQQNSESQMVLAKNVQPLEPQLHSSGGSSSSASASVGAFSDVDARTAEVKVTAELMQSAMRKACKWLLKRQQQAHPRQLCDGLRRVSHRRHLRRMQRQLELQQNSDRECTLRCNMRGFLQHLLQNRQAEHARSNRT